MQLSAWKSFSIVAFVIIIIGWFLRRLNSWDRPDDDYAIRAYESYYVDPTNLYKYYGSYGRT